jgi:hypothetical protein
LVQAVRARFPGAEITKVSPRHNPAEEIVAGDTPMDDMPDYGGEAWPPDEQDGDR